MLEPVFNPQELEKMLSMQMPFGRYKGLALIDLPESYLVWFQGQGFPNGELGRLLAQVYEIKLNGLEDLIRGLKCGRTPPSFNLKAT